MCSDERFRNGAEAVRLATKACEMTSCREHAPIRVLAAAYAEAGDFEQAVKYQRQEIEMLGDGVDTTTCEKRLELYRNGKPFHQNQ